MKPTNDEIIAEYARSIVEGRKIACREKVQECERFFRDLENPAYEFDSKDPEFVIRFIETCVCHKEGESVHGEPLLGKPLLLEPWEKFIVYNLLGFRLKGTKERRFKEAFLFIARKNGKTPFAAALALALAFLERKSGSRIYIVGAVLKQARQAFDHILFNLDQMGELRRYRVLDNNAEHSIARTFFDKGQMTGSLRIEALAANPDKQDSLVSNIQICDELHAYKNAKQYNVIKESGKAYSNRLCIGITTGGDNPTGFCYQRLQYCRRVLNQTCPDEQLFIFICKADEDDNGDVDYTSAAEHEKANPNYGVSIRPGEIMDDAIQAQNDPQQRKDFLAKRLNIFTSAMKAYFDVEEFRRSDAKYGWTIEQLSKLPIKWYGGADLSRLHDLTTAALYGTYKDVDIVIPHCWFPVTAAYKKADEDNIPLFGWKDDGWLTMSNSPTVNHAEVVNWFRQMRSAGFNIAEIGHDRKFCREYFIGMRSAGFKVVDQPQYFYKKSEGFRHIEVKAKNGKLYYCHAAPYEYCVQNVHAIEKTDDMIQYDKIEPEQRIDVFDASVFACVRMLECLERSRKAQKWLEET
ncbi:MAG: terminase large subunit [Eubacteriales bacterium]|nr:terminase large subunit [Eubacteriales bacterium]